MCCLDRISLIATVACVVTLWAGLVVVAAVFGILMLNRSFFGFLSRRKGLAFACASFPLHMIYYCCCALSVMIAEAHWYSRSHGKGVIVPTPHGAKASRDGSDCPARGNEPRVAMAGSVEIAHVAGIQRLTSEARHENWN